MLYHFLVLITLSVYSELDQRFDILVLNIIFLLKKYFNNVTGSEKKESIVITCVYKMQGSKANNYYVAI